MNDSILNISEIFHSIQGEGARAGERCVFVRLQGCPLRCRWCDTPYALDLKRNENIMSAVEIIDRIRAYDCRQVMFTGGEPLSQPEIIPLMQQLCDDGCEVFLETAGNISLANIDKRIIKIVDMKCPGSAMDMFNNYANLALLQPKDELKFVIAGRDDYQWTKNLCKEHSLYNKIFTIHLSPVFGELEPSELIEWIIADNLPVRINLQIHKYIWHPDKRGV